MMLVIRPTAPPNAVVQEMLSMMEHLGAKRQHLANELYPLYIQQTLVSRKP